MDSCDSVDCAHDRCVEQNVAACATFGYEANDGSFVSACLNDDPSCVLKPELGCSNVCGSDDGVGGQLVGNGQCEDGHEDSSSSVCDRSTDCEDCGPHPCAPAGGTCTNHGDCCGFYGPGALCVSIMPSAPAVCFVTCDDTQQCPPGFRCNPTSGDSSVCVSE